MKARKVGALLILAAGLGVGAWGLWSRDGGMVVAGGAGVCVAMRLLYGFWPWDDEGWDRL